MKYFISFVASEDSTGNCVVDWGTPICEYSDIQDIEKYLQKSFNLSKAVVTNWRRMELPE